jgi:hypothetical protein
MRQLEQPLRPTSLRDTNDHHRRFIERLGGNNVMYSTAEASCFFCGYQNNFFMGLDDEDAHEPTDTYPPYGSLGMTGFVVKPSMIL